MARIRTIKPEFWTDERLSECSVSARLLFIGMLNFSDDNGNQGYSSKRLKMQIFPADMIETQPLINELLTQGVLIEYSVSGEKYLHIKGFRTHQVINRPSTTKIPQPSFIEDSLSTQESITDGREGKGRELIGAKAPVAKADAIPAQIVVDVFHEVLPELPKVKLLTDKRKRSIGSFCRFVLTSKKTDGERRAKNKDEAIGWIRSYFERARENDFLMGRVPKVAGHEGWVCDIDYLLSEKGMKQVIEKTGMAA